MKYLGSITDPKDLVNKEYVDSVGSEITNVNNVLDYEGYLTNNGKYQITADILESGVWSYSRKDANTTRGRTKFLLPVRAGMQIYYENTTFDSYFGILETPTSYGSYIQFGSWYTGASGTLNITKDGYLVFNIRNHADTSATVDPADFDSVVTISSEIRRNVLLKYTGEAPANSLTELPDNSWWWTNGSTLQALLDEGFIWELNTEKNYVVRKYFLQGIVKRYEIFAAGGAMWWTGWQSNAGINWVTMKPDTTLTAENVPADAKIVGDNILLKYTGNAPQTSITELPDNSWWFVSGADLQPLLGANFVWELTASSNYVVRKYFLQGATRRYEVFTAGGTMMWTGYATTGGITWAPENIPNLIDASESIILTQRNSVANGITWEWQADGSCKVWGTATATSVNNIIPGTGLPDFLHPTLREISGSLSKLIGGDNVEFSYKSTSEDVYISLWWSDGTATKYDVVKNGYGVVTIPQDTTRWGARLYVASGTTIPEDEPVIVSDIHIKKFCEDVATGGGVTTAKFLGFGHSTTTGSVWTTKSVSSTYPHGVGFDHLCLYDDAPYAGLASGLGVRKENVDYTLISSTTFMTDANSVVGGTNCFLNCIKRTDLEPYDYVLAHLGARDIRLCPLGDLSSTAGDGSVVGGVLDLLDYIQTSNPLCQPIVLSTMPYNEPGAGVDVFHTIIHGPAGDVTIADMDAVMHQLAEQEHFIYIDFQDMWLSYHWPEFTATPVDSFWNVHFDNDRAYRTVSEYLRRKVVAS